MRDLMNCIVGRTNLELKTEAEFQLSSIFVEGLWALKANMAKNLYH
jgi:hypothetical protein